jgi:hypothetical protein
MMKTKRASFSSLRRAKRRTTDHLPLRFTFSQENRRMKGEKKIGKMVMHLPPTKASARGEKRRESLLPPLVFPNLNRGGIDFPWY